MLDERPQPRRSAPRGFPYGSRPDPRRPPIGAMPPPRLPHGGGARHRPDRGLHADPDAGDRRSPGGARRLARRNDRRPLPSWSPQSPRHAVAPRTWIRFRHEHAWGDRCLSIRRRVDQPVGGRESVPGGERRCRRGARSPPRPPSGPRQRSTLRPGGTPRRDERDRRGRRRLPRPHHGSAPPSRGKRGRRAPPRRPLPPLRSRGRAIARRQVAPLPSR